MPLVARIVLGLCGAALAVYAAASLTGYLHPRSLRALVRATVAGKRHGHLEGRELQLPAEFVLAPGGRIALAHYGRDVGDDARRGQALTRTP